VHIHEGIVYLYKLQTVLVIIRHGNDVGFPNKMEDKTFGRDVDKIPSQEKL